MPSQKFIPVEQTRSYLLEVGFTSRFTNLNNACHLPPISKSLCSGEHYVPYFNNQKIFKTVGEWFETWRPWQKRMLLCGIVDRLSVTQLQLLLTTLEPVSHELSCYRLSKNTGSKNRHKAMTNATSQVKVTETIKAKCDISETITVDANKSVENGVVLCNSMKEISKPLCKKATSVITTGSENNRISNQSTNASIDEEHTKKKPLNRAHTQNTEDRNSNSVDVIHKPSVYQVHSDSQIEQKVFGLTPLYEVHEQDPSSPLISTSSLTSLLHYSDQLSSDTIQSAIKEVTQLDVVSSQCLEDDDDDDDSDASGLDHISQYVVADVRIGTNTPTTCDDKHPGLPIRPYMPDVQGTKAKCVVVDRSLVEHSSYHTSKIGQMSNSGDKCVVNNVVSNNESIEKHCISMHVTDLGNITFLYNSMEHRPNGIVSKYKDHNTNMTESYCEENLASHTPNKMADVRLRSRHWLADSIAMSSIGGTPSNLRSNLGSSKLSTPDFFSRRKIERQGLMQKETNIYTRAMDTVLSPDLGQDGCLLPIQKGFKPQRWWPRQPETGMGFIQAHKKPLLDYFKQQLLQVWQWLMMWSEFEKLALLNHIIKLCTREVLVTLHAHCVNRMCDVLNVNSLPDHLLFYVFCLLSEQDIHNSAQVCKRWGYLCSCDELWIVKCQQLGKQEGLDNITDLLNSLSPGDMCIDWQQAYSEIRMLTHDARVRMNNPPALGTVQANDGNEGNDNTNRRLTKVRFCASQEYLAEELQVLQGRASQIGFTDNHVSGDEDSHPQGCSESTDYDTMQTGAKIQLKRSNRVRVKRSRPDDEDLAFDVRPDLVQAPDILGQYVSSLRPEWTAPLSEPNWNRRVLGQVRSVKRVRKLKAHAASVTCIWFDQRRLVSGAMDRIVRIWDIRSGRSIHKLLGHMGGIRCLQFDDDILITGSWDRTVMVWCMKTFVRKTTLSDNLGCVCCVSMDQQYIVSGSHDGTVHIYSRDDYVCHHMIDNSAGPVNCLSFDGHYIIAGCSDGQMKICDIQNMDDRSDCTLQQAPTSVTCMTVKHNLVLVGTSSGEVFFWNKQKRSLEAGIQAHTAQINQIVYVKGRFLTASSDGTIKEWDLLTMTCVRSLNGHKGAVRDLKMSADRLVSCSDDRNIRIWDLAPEIIQKPCGKRRNKRNRRA